MAGLSLFVVKKVVFYFKNIEKIEIVSGHAKGADQLGERFATERKLGLKLFTAEWEKYGRSAGYRRNEEMGRYADALVAFQINGSKGTQHMIDFAKKNGLKVRVVKM